MRQPRYEDGVERIVIPEGVRRLVSRSIPTVPHLEALMLLHQSPDRIWHQEQLAQRLTISADACGTVLHDLGGAGFIHFENPQEAAVRYSPASNDTGQLVDELAHEHARNLNGITKLINVRAQRKAQLKQ